MQGRWWAVAQANLIWWRAKENIATGKLQTLLSKNIKVKHFCSSIDTIVGLRLFVCVCLRRLSLFMEKDWKGFELKELIKMGDYVFGKYEDIKRGNNWHNLHIETILSLFYLYYTLKIPVFPPNWKCFISTQKISSQNFHDILWIINARHTIHCIFSIHSKWMQQHLLRIVHIVEACFK